jgi:Fe-S cluster biogenesis protein NfuA
VIDEVAIRPALDEARSLVQADGGDMQLVSLDETQGRLDLKLVLEGASCEECVLPRDLLEQIVLNMLQRQVPAVTAVHIDDPREHPDYVPGGH